MTSPSTSLRYNSQNPETPSRNPRKRPTSPLSLRERSRKKAIRVQLLSYDQEDIYNVDETALFWKATTSTTLATEQLPGGKVEKARITANFCCNATGTHKLLI